MLSHPSQHYGVTWTLDYAVTSFKLARWKVRVSSLWCKPLKGTMAGVDINTLTMEQYLALSRENQAPGKTPSLRIKMRMPMIMLIESLTLWVDRLTSGAGNTWDILKKAFIQRYCTPSKAAKRLEDIYNFNQENDESLYQAWERSSDTDGLAAIISKLDNLGRDMKKLKENVYAIQVGRQICKGPHLDKECPLNEEVKQVEEVKYGEFGRPAPFNETNGSKFHVGPPRYYTRTDNRPPYREKRLCLEELMIKHQSRTTNRAPSSSTRQCKVVNADHEKPNTHISSSASVNVMPRNTSEYLRLANIRKTNMLVEIADMTKKETLSMPFLVTIHTDVLDKNISLGIDNARVSYDMEKKDHNFTTHTKKIFMIRSNLENRSQSPAATMTDNRTMAEMLCAPTEGYTASYSNHPHRELANLINIFNIPSKDCLEVSVSNKQSGNPTFSLHKEIASPKVTHEINDSKGCTFLYEELPDIDSFNDIHPHFDDNPLSGSTTFSSNSLLEEFTNELALITYPPDYDDNLKCDIESDLREIEFLLYQGEDSDFKDSIDQTDLANRDDLFVDPTPEMFTNEQPPDYSLPPRFDDFSKDDDLPLPDNEDKVFNPGILIYEKSVKIITRVAQEKKLAISFAYLVFEDFDPPFYELLVFKDVLNSMRLLPFSSKNEEKFFKPGIYTSEKVHSCFLPELSHPGYPVFKVNLIFKCLMRIFNVKSGKNTPPLDVLLFHFYPP
nr:hypothetical protein [Tanacetum cinerariifolium]